MSRIIGKHVIVVGAGIGGLAAICGKVVHPAGGRDGSHCWAYSNNRRFASARDMFRGRSFISSDKQPFSESGGMSQRYHVRKLWLRKANHN
jgi:hypothetical protein